MDGLDGYSPGEGTIGEHSSRIVMLQQYDSEWTETKTQRASPMNRDLNANFQEQEEHHRTASVVEMALENSAF
jgi:hypothetical protein